MNEQVYLRTNVKVEPLWNNWYAWPLLMQPVTAGCITAKLHLRILDSYLQAPHIHKAALKNPAMRGGPFMDYSGGIEKVTKLVNHTRSELADLIQISEDLSKFNNVLIEEAQGFSLAELYERIPESLRGFVELGYDLNNYPSIRLIEPLLYSSDYYKPEMQSIQLSTIHGDDRAFVLSTPRFSDENELNLPLTYNDPLVDKLFRMKYEPGSLRICDEIAERFDLNSKQIELLYSFFTTQEPPKPAALPEEGVRIRYFGHATVLLETPDVTVMTDPLISYKFDDASERYDYLDLPERIDYVVLTHSHQDHVMFETLLQIRHKIGTIIVPKNNGGTLQDPSLRFVLKAAGFENVIEMDEMDELPVKNGRIMGLPFFGEHGDLHIRSKLAFFFEFFGTTVLCAADSNNIEPKMYEHLHRAVGDIDYIFIGMESSGAPMSWLYGPLYPKPLERKMDQSRRLNGSDNVRAQGIIEQFSPKQVFVYAMGMEPWLTYISSISYDDDSAPIVESGEFIKFCESRGIKCERLNGLREVIINDKEES
ncbi:MBL fold metallo-hydrolase [Thalassotalea sp. 1_MG-2023]|uniref:MBL fold metallo-hydrolase n=1 Tax=Thalassotalea sp. 1_MG-2023 TaxID=3062680 RepID=UPI0026E28A71|nr:MBL fold metallo-hydrolase [Thalassotalea sp. 1_MG-2023]MDO6428517.1 MBL fold metallo-hydrolase [Thalassotalea sp. 1_MG-2023]